MGRFTQAGAVRTSLLLLVAVSLFVGVTGCALIFDGAKEPSQRSSDVQWGYLILDILFTGIIGIVVDFATGAIYKKKGGGMLSYTPEGAPLSVCDKMAARVKGSSRNTLDDLKTWMEGHAAGCPVCHSALSGQ